MYYQGVTFRMVLVRFLVPLAIVAVGAGLVTAWAYVAAYGFGGDLRLVLFLVIFIPVGGVCGLLFFWSSWPWVGMAAAFLLFAGMAPAVTAFQNAILDVRGRTGVCEVLDVVKHTYQEYVSGTGDDPGHWETRTVYRHSLRCPPGGPDRLTRDRTLAREGDALKVVWDPDGRVSPMPASERVDPETAWRVFFVMVGIALLVLWIEACVDLVRYPRRSGWDMGMNFMSLAEDPPPMRRRRMRF